MSVFNPIAKIATELNISAHGVEAVVRMFAEGSTVPFIARYRKEATGNLDEVQIRTIEERHQYIVELEKRRDAVLTSITEQGKLTPELEAKIRACDTKSVLEDLYLPFRPKRRTRATIAKEKGLEPLALRILEQSAVGDVHAEAAAFVSDEQGVADVQQALAGARDIVAETIAETAEMRALVRQEFMEKGAFVSQPVPDKTKDGPTKFEQYYDFEEAVATIPSHRYLAIRRGEREGVLRVSVSVEQEALASTIASRMQLNGSSPFAEQLRLASKDSVERLLCPGIETDVRVDVKMRADQEAVEVFARNLRSLLLSSPLGERAVIGIDPGLRTGCKCVAVDATGQYLDTVTIYPSQGQARAEGARQDLLGFIAQFQPYAVAVGNGTAGRETESFVKQLLRDAKITNIVVVSVSESGASIYSASDTAREEFPDLDLTIRGAISIARRLQDPLSELVKIDPKAIGVGQYQHDVHQPMLQRKLGEVVESCVNHVGVELNTASVPLLSRVSGVTSGLAKRIVEHRNQNGAFKSRHELQKVSGLGPKTFEQAAGFLRIRGGVNPLDSSAVHPERYPLIERIAADLQVKVQDLVGNAELVKGIDIKKYVEVFAKEGVGEPTLRDIVAELSKPGRDPRDTFEPPKFRDDVCTMTDLQIGMHLEGVVTNVTAFGAFVDIGVHEDGLVHISALSDRFIKDPSEVVKAGDKLKVWVLDVDLARKRISLSARHPEDLQAGKRPQGNNDQAERPNRDAQGRSAQGKNGQQNRGPRASAGGGSQNQRPPRNGFANNPFANLLGKR